LAIIQLKKVLSLHEKFVSAHLLLALVAIETNQIELARKELEKVLNIDRGNVTALNYFKETDALRSKAADRKSSRISKDAVVYTSGNETIIQPKTASEGNARNVVLDILLGLVIGIAVCWFVLLPAKIQSANNTANQQVVEYSDQLEVKNATIIALEKEVQAAKEEAAAAKQQMTNTETKTSSYEALFEAQKLVAAKDYESAAEVLEGIDADSLSEGVRASYDAVSQQVNDVVLGVYYNRGVAQFNSKNYEEAKVLLEKVVTLNPQHDYAVYYLAKSYEQLNDVEQAKKYYEQLLQLLPESTRRAKTAKKFLDAHR
jgi:tetratricopeptide (TPR) repeat protein